MRQIRAALARLAGVFGKPGADEDLRDELQTHVDMATAENVRRGMQPDEARRQALLESGGLTLAAEAVRDQRGLPWLENVGADIRYALRGLRHSPTFTAVVVVTLALGIGANTAIFSVIHGVLLKPLPHRDGDRLVYLRHSREGPGGRNLNFSVPEVRDLRNGVPSLAGIAEYSSWSAVYQGTEGTERLAVGLVTGNYFEVMGLSQVVGRLTGPNDDGPGASPVAVLTYQFWINRFGGDSGIVGKPIMLNKTPVTVIGVLQPAPFFPERIDALLNMVNSEHHLSASMVEGRTHRMTEVVARLAPNTTLEQATSQVGSVYARMHRDFKEAYDPGSRYRVAVIPFKEVLSEKARLTLWLLMGAAAFVLIISAANVANLTLMRGVRREHELVTRAALGASVARLRRLVLTENLVLAVIGGIGGVVIAIGGAGLLRSLAARYSSRANEIRLDGVVLGFTLAVSVSLALLLSFLAWMPKEGMLASAISVGRRTSGGLRKQRLQRWLVVVQVAVSVMLLAGAGLLTRTLTRLSKVDTGLKTEEVLTMEVTLLTRAEQRNPADVAAARERFANMRRELAGLPGVIVTAAGSLPLRRSGVVWEVKAEGKEPRAGDELPRAEMRAASAEYFRAAGIPIINGRPFATTDDGGSAPVVIINRTLADRLFPGEDPVGRRIAWTGELVRLLYPSLGEWRTIVGVAGDTRDGELDAQPLPVAYSPSEPWRTGSGGTGGGLLIRADSNVASLVGPATRIVRRVAPAALIEDVMTIRQFKDQSVSSQRLNAELISLFGVLAVVIAAVGIGGVLAFSVSTRTNEIGIRMSLGADRGRVERMILTEGGVLVARGLVLGVIGGFFATRAIRGLLFGVAPNDPMTFAGVALMMAAIGIVACWIPALRAARIDPVVAMRAT
jgi:predicted permease